MIACPRVHLQLIALVGLKDFSRQHLPNVLLQIPSQIVVHRLQGQGDHRPFRITDQLGLFQFFERVIL